LGDETHFVEFLKKEIINEGSATLLVPDKGFWFLPIEKAAQLVIKAGGMGEGGEVFSLDRGVRLSMRTIVKDLCHEAGLVPERDVEFISDPSRWDRWLLEELSLGEDPYPEKENPTAFSHIRIVETKSYGWERLREGMEEIENLLEKGDEEGLIERFELYFPDYRKWKGVEGVVNL
jgi:FlaA1/EpsC-like NDP-sugar epimerase